MVLNTLQREKVCIIGSGNWGSCTSKIVGTNVSRLWELNDALWDKEVNMWVYEEIIDGCKLSEIINTKHENVKYLPGIELPSNVIAVPDLLGAVSGATLLIFVVPHQFVERICNQLKGNISNNSRAISLIKGLDCERGGGRGGSGGNSKDANENDDGGLDLVSTRIKRLLNIDVSVLMGANLANDIAQERFSEATIGFSDHINGAIWKEVFERPFFRISLIEDVTGVELCGALKNIIAVAAGFIDGLYSNESSDNTKAAIIRRGLLEMRLLCRLVDSQVRDETFFESCGLADVITSSYGGRNRKVAEAFITTGKSLDELEKELLNGQKLQGPLTAREVYKWLSKRGLTHRFPIMTLVYRICYEGRDPKLFLSDI